MSFLFYENSDDCSSRKRNKKLGRNAIDNTPMNPLTKQLTFGIMLALILWGIALAIGSTGVFIQDSMLDLRKSLIVLVCVALFLGLWSIVLLGRKPTRREELAAADSSDKSNVVANASSLPWSRPGLTTFALGVSGTVLWAVAIATWKSVSTDGTTILGWLAALCILGSATSGIISLSQPVKRRGKWLGLLGLVGFAAAFIAFLARMSP